MKLEFKFIGPDGDVVTRTGEARPKTDRPMMPPGLRVALSDEDMLRLRAATNRLRRAIAAFRALGQFDLRINVQNGKMSFDVLKPVPDIPLKALAVEVRPFFLNDDPLYFPSLVKVRSLGALSEVGKAMRAHTRRWIESAFNGTMGITIGTERLDLHTVVNAWFNDDLFHTLPSRDDAPRLDDLVRRLGGGDQARAVLASHLSSSLEVIGQFLADVASLSPEYEAWVSTTAGEQKTPQLPNLI